MTWDEFKVLKLFADRKYALEKRLFERRLNDKYKRLMRLGFHTSSRRTAYLEQLQSTHDAELHIGLANIWGDIEAEFFGTRSMEEIEKILPGRSRSKVIDSLPENR